jgi:hypothetical protein
MASRSAIDSNTWAGRPRSVMTTGPWLAARLAHGRLGFSSALVPEPESCDALAGRSERVGAVLGRLRQLGEGLVGNR